jgi:hypothetical protein
MSKQPPSSVRLRTEPVGTEHDVMTHRVSMGVHVTRRLRRCCADMYADVRKVVAEELLHVLPEHRF